MFDTLLRTLFIIGLGGLIYLLGMAGAHYKWQPVSIVNQVLDELQEMHKHSLMTVDTVDADEMDKLLRQKTVHWDKELAEHGYTLTTIRYSTDAYLLNMNGEVVYRWHLPYYDIWKNPKHTNKAKKDWIYIEKAEVDSEGNLLAVFSSSADSPYGYGIAKVDKDSNLLWKYSKNAHHDFDIDPVTGNITTLIHHFTSARQKPYDNVHYPTLEDFVVVLSPDGKELKRVSVLDAFYNSPYRALLNDYHKNKLFWDRTHTNTVSILTPDMAPYFPQFKAGQVMISLRNMDTVAVLDMDTKQIVWAFNGIWRAQHAPRFLKNGNILLLDNKGYVKDHVVSSRVVEFNPRTLGIDWNYPQHAKQQFFTASYGRVQSLGNGNILISDSMNGRIVEVTPEGKHAWEFTIPRLSRKTGQHVRKTITMEGKMRYFIEEPLVFAPEISGFIVSATRYKEEQLPFLFTQNKDTHP